jgi:hypothetical protein
MKSKACTSSTPDDCCNIFNRYVDKIIISSNPICSNSVKQVTINGVNKGGGIYFQSYNSTNNNIEAELKLTALRLNGSSDVLTQHICLTLAPPCDSVNSFCQGNNGLCQFALFNTDKHTCCPTCNTILSPSKLPESLPQSSQKIVFAILHVEGAFTTLKAYQLLFAIKNVTQLDVTSIKYKNKKDMPNYSFDAFFTLGPFENDEMANIYGKKLIPQLLTFYSDKTYTNHKQLNVLDVSYTILQSPSQSPSSPLLPLSPPSPLLSPSLPSMHSPISPSQPFQTSTSPPPPTKCVDTKPACPNPNWPVEYCKLYPGVPIKCPCLCS